MTRAGMLGNRHARATILLGFAGLVWWASVSGRTGRATPQQIAEQSRALWTLVAALFLAGRCATGLARGWLARLAVFCIALAIGCVALVAALALLPWAVGAPAATAVAVGVALLFFPRSALTVDARANHRPGSRQESWSGEAPSGRAAGVGPNVPPTGEGRAEATTTSAEVLAEVNARLRRPRHAPWVGIATALGVIAALGVSPVAASATVVAGLALMRWAGRSDDRRRTTEIAFAAGGPGASRLAGLSAACSALAAAQRIWIVPSREQTGDWKRNGGATSLFTQRAVAIVRTRTPPGLRLSGEVWGLDAGSSKAYFFPDDLLVFRANGYETVPYARVTVAHEPTRVVESGVVPRDAEVVDETWRYVRKDGGPDRRFASNRRLPVVRYGALRLSVGSVASLDLHVASAVRSGEFARSVASLLPNARAPSGGAREQDERGQHPGPARGSAGGRRERADEPRPTPPPQHSPYAVLGVAETASWQEITAAYHRAAMQNHPDKVAGLDPAFRELADRRMKEINAAYTALKRGRGS